MIRLKCPRDECEYSVTYPDSMEPLLADGMQNGVGTYQCPLCHSFGLKVQKSRPKKEAS